MVAIKYFVFERCRPGVNITAAGEDDVFEQYFKLKNPEGKTGTHKRISNQVSEMKERFFESTVFAIRLGDGIEFKDGDTFNIMEHEKFDIWGCKLI